MIDMVEDSELLDFLYQLGKALAEMFGNNCEIVISDLDQPDHSILYIFNGFITNREIGDPLPPQALERVRSCADGYYINYKDAKNGREFKTSTLEYNFGGRNIAFCINYDYTSLVPAHNIVSQFLEMSSDTPQFTDSLENIANSAIDDAIAQSGKSKRLMSKEDRMRIIAQLDKQGILQMQKSVTTIARRLGISRYTVYNYLNEMNLR